MRLAEPEDFFVLRAPLLSFDELAAQGGALDAPAGDDERLAAALQADRLRVRGWLRGLVQRPLVREALALASPSLLHGLPAWLEAPDGELGRKVERTLYRYAVRMASRPTPFGLFAGMAVGTFSASTALEPGPAESSRWYASPNAKALAEAAGELLRDPAVRRELRYWPNTTLYEAGGDRARYVEASTDPATGRHAHRQLAIQLDPAVRAVLESAHGGATFGALAEQLAAAAEVSRPEAEAFLDELIDAQLLVSELAPPLTGPEPGRALAELIGRLGPTSPAAARWSQAIDPERGGPRDHVVLHRAVTRAELGPDIRRKIERGVELLHRLGSAAPAYDPLAVFARRFADRYGEREVPLVTALDPDLGVGLDWPIGSDLGGPQLLQRLAIPPLQDRRAPVRPREELLVRRIAEAAAAGSVELRLSESDLRVLEVPEAERLPLPASFTVTAAAAADGAVLVRAAMGPPATAFLGRFCHADPELRAKIGEHVRREEARAGGAALAEIVHLPAPDLLHVVSRPVLHGYEIPYAARSGAPEERQLPVSDLLLSHRAGRLALRSRRLDREVLPRLSSAHDFRNADLTLYRFLCLLQRQGTAWDVKWDWGWLSSQPFLPRVVAGEVVLALARWRLYRDELAPLRDGPEAKRYAAAQALRARRRLPRWVGVREHDQVLVLDLDRPHAVEVLASMAERDEVWVSELFRPDALLARGPEGRFTHELMVPFVAPPDAELARRAAPSAGSRDALQAPASPPAPPAEAAEAAEVPRTFFPSPGAPWLSARLYAGEVLLDDVLREVVRPVIDRAQASGAAKRWFFIRDHDGDWHLRLRIEGAPDRLWGEVWPDLARAAERLRVDGRLWRLTLDTYEREVERFGGAGGILLAESAFHEDSAACLSLLQSEALAADEDARFRVALLGCHLLLEDLGLSPQARCELLAPHRDGLWRQHRGDGDVERAAGAMFREQRAALEALLAGTAPEDPLSAHRAAFSARSAAVAALRAHAPTVARPLLHLHCNRLLRAQPTLQEMLISDWLLRLAAAGAGRSSGYRRPPPPR